jgi:hypothetical protein
MTHRAAGLLSGRFLLLLAMACATSLRAQDPRDSLFAKASNEFDDMRQVQMLVTVLDPALGPPRGVWSAAIQLLAQTLTDVGQDSTATFWLRWAIRIAPDLQPDFAQFPLVATVFRAARQFVDSSRTSGDSVTMTTWRWAAEDARDSVGRIELAAAAQMVPLQVSVDGVGPLGPGAIAQVAPGSYEVRASASGYDSVRVTREMLPGVTTVLEFRLHQVVAQVPPPQLPSAHPGHLVSPRGKRFPWVWAALGAAGAGTAAFLLLRHPSGSISITVPNPP